METYGRELDELERQRLEVYRAQATPGWAWPSFGLVVLVFLSSFELRRAWVAAVASLGYACFVGFWAGAIAKRSGVQPRLRGMPKPLFGELVRFWVAGALVAAAVVALGLAVSFLAAGVVAGVVTIIGGRHFDRRYRRRADALLASSAPRPQ